MCRPVLTLSLLGMASCLLGCTPAGAPTVYTGEIHDLSMRFVHPELYETRDENPRESALRLLKTRHYLHRGQTREQVRAILGTPTVKPEGTPRDKATQWGYGLNNSYLTISFDQKGRVRLFEWTFEEGGPASGSEAW